MSKRKRSYEAPDMLAMIQRVTRALVRRAEEGDLEALTAIAEAERTMHAALDRAIRAAHDGPCAYSWTEIGRELHITRQAAQQRAESTERTAS